MRVDADVVLRGAAAQFGRTGLILFGLAPRTAESFAHTYEEEIAL